MAGQRPFMPPVDMNLLRQTSGLLPSLETALGNSQRLLNQLYGFRMPLGPDTKSLDTPMRIQQENPRSKNTSWESYDYGSNRPGRMRDFTTDYDSRRERMDDYFGNRDRQRDSYYIDSRLYPRAGKGMHSDLAMESSSRRYGDRYGKDLTNRIDDYPSYYSSALERRRSQEVPPREFAIGSSRQQYGRPMGLNATYGVRKTTDLPPSAQLRPNCYIVPPTDESQKRKLSEKPLGCRTIFVGGLPSLTDEFIVNEIFYVCGPIESINVNAGKGVGTRKFCHLRFVNRESVEKAILFSGFSLVIGDGEDRDAKTGKIQVDYAKSKEDQREFREEDKMRSQTESQEAEGDDQSSKFDSKKARGLLEELRKDTAIFKTWQILTQWFERGECTRLTSNTFYSLLNSTHSHIKRLMNERKEHEALVEKEKNQQLMRANVMKQQCEAILNVFEAASKKKSWDHFTKPQRRNITQWHQLIKDEIKLTKEVEIQNRVEVGMDLDDESHAPPEPIEQPALEMVQENPDDQEGTDEPSQPKKQKLDSESDSDSNKQLKAENEKLRSQVTSLKSLAEQNTNLMWTVQSYKHQADLISQQYSDLVKEKEGQISRLTSALQGLQQFLQIVDISEPQRRMSNLEVLVDVSKDDPNVTDMDLDTRETTKRNEKSQETGPNEEEENKGSNAEGEKQDWEALSKEGGDETARADENAKGESVEDRSLSEEFQKGSDEKLGKGVRQQEALVEGQNEAHSKVKLEDKSEDEADQEVTSEDVRAIKVEQKVTAENIKGTEEDEQVRYEEKKGRSGEIAVTAAKGRKRKQRTEEPEEEPEITENVSTDSAEEEKPVRRATRRSTRMTQSRARQESSLEEEPITEGDQEDESALEEQKSSDKETGEEDQGGEHESTEVETERTFSEQDEEEEASGESAEDATVEAAEEDEDETKDDDRFAEDSDDEKRRGKARFVEIDEEQFEVIDDMGEDSEEEETDTRSEVEETPEPETKAVTQEISADQSHNEPQYTYDQAAEFQQYYQAYQTYSWPSSTMPSYSAMDYGPSVVRLSGQELVLVGVLCSYLHVCPSGATIEEITEYLKGQFKQVQKDTVTTLLDRLSVVFKSSDWGDGGKKWKFCGFEMARWIAANAAKSTTG